MTEKNKIKVHCKNIAAVSYDNLKFVDITEIFNFKYQTIKDN